MRLTPVPSSRLALSAGLVTLESSMSQPRLFVQQLTVMDVAVLDAVRGLVGQSWIVDLELEGPLNDSGMVLDFGEVKRLIKRRIDEVADHVLLVPTQATGLTLDITGNDTSLRFETQQGRITHRGPLESLCLIEASVITLQATVLYVNARLRELLDEIGMSTLTPHVTLREEIIEGAGYHYCHGLKKHGGNCQRIAHGHRSRVHVWLNDARAPAEETEIATAWRDIYLGTSEDLLERTIENGQEYLRFSHRSGQGEFELTLPASRVFLVETDSTVEWIAAHLAQRVQSRHPAARVRVAAFEGVQKGAIAHG